MASLLDLLACRPLAAVDEVGHIRLEDLGHSLPAGAEEGLVADHQTLPEEVLAVPIDCGL